MDAIRRGVTVVGFAVFSVLVAVVPAFATPPDPSTVIGTSAETTKNELLDIAAAVLPYAAILVALTLGWRFARKFVKG